MANANRAERFSRHFRRALIVADVSISAAVSVSPGENYEAPQSWAERAYHKLIYYNRVDKGSHFCSLGAAATLLGRGLRGLQASA